MIRSLQGRLWQIFGRSAPVSQEQRLPVKTRRVRFRFTLQKKLILAFLFISALFCTLGLTARNALRNGEIAVKAVQQTNTLVLLAKEANINLAKAGQLPKKIETATSDLEAIERNMALLQEDFARITDTIKRADCCEKERILANNFIQIGNSFYEALAGFLPIRKHMLIYTTEYKGRIRPLPDVLAERELGHIKFIRSLANSIEKKTRLTGGMDYHECGFYQWYTTHPSEDEDIAEVFEEIDPLHQKLHNYAAAIDQELAAGNDQAAAAILRTAEKDLHRLGLYFAGVRNLADEKYQEAQEEFYARLDTLDAIHDQATDAEKRLEEFLQGVVRKEAVDRMIATNGLNRTRIVLFSLLGLALAALISGYATRIIGKSIRSTRRMMDDLARSATEFDAMAEHLSANASQTLHMASNATNAMTETATNIDAVAASVHEMNAAIEEISKSSVSSAEIANEAAEEATSMVTLARALQDNSVAIGSVSDLIRTIAFKINLLALNANVEAARAGEAGAGFAVVAGEVKNLATATAEATDEITNKIKSIQEGCADSTEAITKIAATITKVRDNSSGIAAAVEEQSAITADINNNISGVVKLSQEATDNISEVTTAAEDTSERSTALRKEGKSLASNAEELSRLLEKL